MEYLIWEFDCFERYENLRFYLLKMIVIINVQSSVFFFFQKKLSLVNGGNHDVGEDNNVFRLGDGNERNCGYKFIYLGI